MEVARRWPSGAGGTFSSVAQKERHERPTFCVAHQLDTNVRMDDVTRGTREETTTTVLLLLEKPEVPSKRMGDLIRNVAV